LESTHALCTTRAAMAKNRKNAAVKSGPAPVEAVPTTPSTVESLDDSIAPAPSTAAPAPAKQPAKQPVVAAPKQPGLLSAESLVPATLVLGLSVLLGFGWSPSNWVALVALQLTLAAGVLGLGNLASIRSELAASDAHRQQRVWLTDAVLSRATANKFANSCQVREKGLKVLQYTLRGAAYFQLFPAISKELKALSKTTSVARRFFKFCRWVKHFEDLEEARDEKAPVLRALLYLRVAANFGADWAEDICSLERIGMLPKGTLSVSFMLFAEYCQFVLALVEVYVTTAKTRAEEQKAAADTGVKQQRKLALCRLELVKYCSDIGKAVYDCEMSFAHEGVFIGCGFFSAIVSTHKNMVKVLK